MSECAGSVSISDRYERLARKAQKPSRYLGGEFNAIQKDLSGVKVRWALVFPDLYEIGMSNLGLRILYHILNLREDTFAERVFLPAPDFEALMRGDDLPLLSLETRTPLAEFEFIGITLQSETTYTNVLRILELGRIPLLTNKRQGLKPMVIGGGPCTYNPEPIADFFDILFIGEADEALAEMCDAWLAGLAEGVDREGMLRKLFAVEGNYVPSFYEQREDEKGRFAGIYPRFDDVPAAIKRRVVWDLDHSPHPTAFVAPNMNITHDRAPIEVARGCNQGCRFCQAGYAYRPYRERTKETVTELATRTVRESGNDQVSLLSLSIRDYSQLEELVTEVTGGVKPTNTSVSFPSLRPGGLTLSVLEKIQEAGRPGFTFAPEAGTERLRNVINKKVTEEGLRHDIELAFQAGWDHVKFYFMCGLPTETLDDVEGIVRVVKEALHLGRKIVGNRVKIAATVSPFVPKPFTPFQWCSQDDFATFYEKKDYVEGRGRDRSIVWRVHEPESCWLEGIMAKGDRRLGKVILRAYQSGCIMDAWREHFRPDLWHEALEAEGYDWRDQLYRNQAFEEPLPWDHIDVGIKKTFLWKEYQRSLQEKIYRDCPYDVPCIVCGVCAPKEQKAITVSRHLPRRTLEDAPVFTAEPGASRPVTWYRMVYAKRGNGAYLAHLEIQKIFAQAFKRAGIAMAFTDGHNPHPRLTFGPPLPVGVSGECELVDVALWEEVQATELANQVNPHLPQGLNLSFSEKLEGKPASIQAAITSYRYRAVVHKELVAMEGISNMAEIWGRWRENARLKDASFPLGADESWRREVESLESLQLLRADDKVISFEWTQSVANGKTDKPLTMVQTILGLEFPGLHAADVARMEITMGMGEKLSASSS